MIQRRHSLTDYFTLSCGVLQLPEAEHNNQEDAGMLTLPGLCCSVITAQVYGHIIPVKASAQDYFAFVMYRFALCTQGGRMASKLEGAE